MLRTLLAVIAGVVTALLLMFALEAAGLMLFPPPGGLQINNEADLALLVEMSSTGKKTWVVFGWALASLVGGWVAARTSRLHPRGAALAVATLVVIGVVMNAMAIPHPLWMNALGLLLPVPMALLGARLARRTPPAAV